jgi:2-dehydro-3-deoxygluconokinase
MTPVPRVVTFGEIMLRLSPPGVERLLQSPTLTATFGGGEANVAVSLAHFGFDSVYVTRVPAHALGDAAVAALRREGVETRFVQRGGQRLGMYFAETGAGQRGSTIIYDRAHAAVAELRSGDVDWAAVLDGASWLHVTGITPALGAGPAACVQDAVEEARQRGVHVSVDLNYRRKLWTEQRAREVMRPLVHGVDVIVANEEDIQAVLGIEVPDVDVTSGRVHPDAYRAVAEQVSREFDTGMVAVTLRESLSASDNGWSAALWDRAGGYFFVSRRYDVRVVDRIGAGDAFAAGLIAALLLKRPRREALEFAVAAGALKHSIPGDFNRVSTTEVDRLVAGDGSGRVVR